MTDKQCEEITGEINSLRNDLIERDGILDELKKIRELLESINWCMVELMSNSDGKDELGNFLKTRIKEAACGKK